MPFIHHYRILNEYNKCQNIKNEYLECLKNESNSKICKPKFTELIECIKNNDSPVLIIENIKDDKS